MRLSDLLVLVGVCALLVSVIRAGKAKPAFRPVPEGVVARTGFDPNGGIVEDRELQPEDQWQQGGVVDTRRGSQFRLQSVPIRAVAMGPGFWRPRMEANAKEGMPTFLRLMEEHGVVDNFRRLSGRKQVEFRDASYGSESDLYKWLEGVSWALQSQDLPELRQTVAAIIDDIAAAQGEDGRLFLNTCPDELYCAGHLVQAAIAYYRATGQDSLLQVACRLADYICQEFGPGKIEAAPGHPEVEMALIELYRTTGRTRYWDLAAFFLGQSQYLNNRIVVGHAVRSGYLCCGGADYYAETGDEQMWANLQSLWQDLVGGKIYITGGMGARGESFGERYELPNAWADTTGTRPSQHGGRWGYFPGPRAHYNELTWAYAESCAQIAHAMWAWRMLLLTGEAQYADVMETILYNGFLSGVSLDGSKYFYGNPLASDGGYQRQSWFPCNCCPPNIHRTLAAVPGYLFSTSRQGLWVHLYDTCQATLPVPDGPRVTLKMDTKYPGEGEIEIALDLQQPAQFTLFLRIPGWAAGAAAAVNDEPLSAAIEPGNYLKLTRRWRPGDTVRLQLPMPVRIMESHPRVAENRGCVALQRGPLVYCFESVDNPDTVLADLALVFETPDPEGGFRPEWQPDLLGGVTVLRRRALPVCYAPENSPLYHPLGTRPTMRRDKVLVTAIPYYAWANRADSAMRVWMPVAGE